MTPESVAIMAALGSFATSCPSLRQLGCHYGRVGFVCEMPDLGEADQFVPDLPEVASMREIIEAWFVV